MEKGNFRNEYFSVSSKEDNHLVNMFFKKQAGGKGWHRETKQAKHLRKAAFPAETEPGHGRQTWDVYPEHGGTNRKANQKEKQRPSTRHFNPFAVKPLS